MADTKSDYRKTKKSPFYIALGGDRKRVVRIVAEDKDEALRLSDKVDPRTATLVALDENGQLLRRGDDAVMEMTNGQRMLVGQGYSTADPDRISQFASGMSTDQLIRQTSQEGMIAENPLTARVAAAQQAMGFGLGSFVDEVMGGDYERFSKALTQAMNDQRPLETFLLQAGVGMKQASNVLKSYPQLAKVFGRDVNKSMLSNTVRSGIAGATGAGVPAAIQAAGEAPSGERLEDAIITGGLATATGGLVSAATPSISAGAGRVMDMIKKSELAQIATQLGISRSAAAVIKNAFNQGGNIQTALDNISKAGEVGMLADAGIAARALADAVSQAGGEPAETVARNIQDRAAQTSTNLQSTLMDTVGTPLTGPKAAVDQIRKRTEADRSSAYTKAYNTPIDYSTGGAGERIMSVVKRIDKKTLSNAIEEANADMLADGVTNRQIRISVDDNGNITNVAEDLNVQQLDYLKRALQTLAENTRDSVTYKMSTQGRRYSNLARDLRQAMGEGIVDADGNRVYDEEVR